MKMCQGLASQSSQNSGSWLLLLLAISSAEDSIGVGTKMSLQISNPRATRRAYTPPFSGPGPPLERRHLRGRPPTLLTSRHFLSTKTHRRRKTQNRSVTIECARCMSILHDVKSRHFSESNNHSCLGHNTRLIRCLSPCTNTPEPSQVSCILVRPQTLFLQSNALRAECCSSVVHLNLQTSSQIPSTTRDPDASVSGRLDYLGGVSCSHSSSHLSGDSVIKVAGVPGELGEVFAFTQSDNHVAWSSVGPSLRHMGCHSSPEKICTRSSVCYVPSIKDLSQTNGATTGSLSLHWPNAMAHSARRCQINTASQVSSFEPQGCENHPVEQDARYTPPLDDLPVATCSNLPSPSSNPVSLDRCEPRGMGRIYRQRSRSLGDLESRTTAHAYQLPGAPGRTSGTSSTPTNSLLNHIDDRQHDSTISAEEEVDQLENPKTNPKESAQFLKDPSNSHNNSPCPDANEYNCGREEQRQTRTDRMVSTERHSSEFKNGGGRCR